MITSRTSVSKLIFKDQSAVVLNYGETDLKALKCNSKRRGNSIPTNNKTNKPTNTPTNNKTIKKQQQQNKNKNTILISSQIVKDDQV